VLSSEGHVRILRELSIQSDWVDANFLINRTGMSARGVANVLGSLLPTGFVAVDEIDQRRYYGVGDHPLAAGLSELYRSEVAAYEEQISLLRDALGENSRIRTAWIFGPAAKGADTPPSKIEIVALFERFVDLPAVDQLKRAVAVRSTFLSERLLIIGLDLGHVAQLAKGDHWWSHATRSIIPLKGDCIVATAKGRVDERHGPRRDRSELAPKSA
jgi:predicted nucleotidyltransferase